jgi:putative two-component system response regulator
VSTPTRRTQGRPLAAVVDNDPFIRRLVVTTLERSGYDCVAVGDVSDGITALWSDRVDVAIVDLGLPGLSGLVLIDHMTAIFPHTAIVVLTGESGRGAAADAQERGADAYLLKPVTPEQLVLSVDGAIRSRRGAVTAVLKGGADETVTRLLRVADARDRETGHHSDQTGRIVAALGAELGLDEAAVHQLRRAALLHDIGKVAVPDEILHKPGPLTEDERVQMRRHVRVGWQILSGSDDSTLQLASEIALAHHERWDGRGYPLELAGEAIPLEARITAVADVFEALTSDRPYRGALSVAVARAVIIEGRGTHFDPTVVDAFVASETIRQLMGRNDARPGAADPRAAGADGLPAHSQTRSVTSRRNRLLPR